MSPPASVPIGLSVATFRGHLARGVEAARPALRLWLGRTAPGEYHSPFPARLRAARAVVVVLALLWLAAGFVGLNATRDIVRTVGHDTAPSVAAAEAIRTGLAGANADFALSTLSNEGAEGALLSTMRLRLRAVRAALVEAAGNVTYGNEERGPITTVLQGLGNYEQLVGRSLASAGNARRGLAFAADDLLHWTVLPAAVTLERVNADHLSEDYGAYLSRQVVAWAVVAAALLVLALVAVQIDVARTAKRLISPGLLAATLAVLTATVLLVMRLVAAQSDLRIAKLDAFDSIYALSSAQALAADFDAGQSFMLVASDDPSRHLRYVAENDLRARRLLDVDPNASTAVARASIGDSGHKGYLGDELANVTFRGERDAAQEAVEAWKAVVGADAWYFADHKPADQTAALAAKLANVPSGPRESLKLFDDALDRVLAINQAAFSSAVASAERDDAPLGAVLIAGFVLAVAAAWFGIGRRLDEYRF